jgi:tripartite-type tricarboxylate transporter receptor subunit TctC
VPEASPFKSFADFLKAAQANVGKYNLGGSALNSANHAAHERLNAEFKIKTTYVPYKGTGDLANAVLGAQIDGAMSYTAFAVNNKSRVRALAVAMDKRHPLLPDTPTLRSSASIGSTAPTAESRCRRRPRPKPGSACRTCSPC